MPSAAPPGRALVDDEIHLWFVFPDEPQLHDPELLERYRRLMSGEERERQRRYLQPCHRHQALVARALVRTTLSRYAPRVPPERWRLTAGEHGRPEIAAPELAPLRFNLSHTTGLMVCGVTMGRSIGVDVEDTRRPVAGLDIARRFFAPSEVQQLRRGKMGFFEIWTLKEAYIKARGAGLSLPLRRFAVRREGEVLSVAFAPELGQAPDSWRFGLLRPTPWHVAALAVESQSPLTARVGRTVPLRGETGLSCEVIGASEGRIIDSA